MQKSFVFIICLFFILSCYKEENLSAKIINESIKVSGGNIFESSEVSFVFRNIRYIGTRNGGAFDLQRQFQDSIGFIKDRYTNDSFVRLVNDIQVEIPDSMVSKYQNSINSVFYFAQLPYKLNDSAVHSEYVNESLINGVKYHKIRVSFDEEGGGKDHDDNFMYWFNTETNFIDYLGYEYITDGGGMRFRTCYNERIIEGMRFVDCVNMKPKIDGSILLENLDTAFENGDLEELSKIELYNIKVDRI